MSSFPVPAPSTASVYNQLYGSIGEALCGLSSTVWTPGYGEKKLHTPLADVFTDELSDDNRKVLDGTLQLYKLALESHDPAVRMTAQAIVVDWARRHADFHLGDAMADAGVKA
jgi:hypothetical protein